MRSFRPEILTTRISMRGKQEGRSVMVAKDKGGAMIHVGEGEVTFLFLQYYHGA